MPGEIQINAITQTPADLFSSPRCFITPDFQRPYVWGKPQIDKFWKDIAGLAKNPQSKHFTGVILLQDADPVGHIECLKVIDGQQRLTTLQLLLAAVRTAYENQNDHAEGENIYNLYLCNRVGVPTDRQDLAYKISHSNREDAVAFRQYIHRSAVNYGAPADPAQGSLFAGAAEPDHNAPAVGEAYRRLLCKVTKYARHHSLGDLQMAILRGVTLALIQAKADEPTVYAMFNRLNSAGTALSLPDMIKAETFQRIAEMPNADDRANAADLWDYNDAYWQERHRVGNYFLSNLGYVLHHWLCADAGKFISDRNDNRGNEKTIAAYQQAIDKSGNLTDNLRNLKKYAAAYRKIQDGDSPEHPDFIRDFIRDFNAAGKKTAYTLALYCLAELHPAAHAQALSDLGAYLMRLTLAGTPAGGLNRTWPQIAHRVAARLRNEQTPPDKQADIIREELLNITERISWPDDDAILRRLGEQSIPPGEAKEVITAIAQHWQGAKSDVVVRDDATLEHIMPRSWQRHWPLPDRPDAEREREHAVQMLGNLTLLHGVKNAEASNDGWQYKRAALRQSDLAINAPLAKLERWDEAAIRARSQELARIACQIWPKPQPPARLM